MKVAVVGSRTVNNLELDTYLPEGVTEIVSGGAKGVDSIAKGYAYDNNLKYKEFLPEYNKYGKGAPLKRNELIADYADVVYAFWDGKSRGTKYVIDYCKSTGKEIKIFISEEK